MLAGLLSGPCALSPNCTEQGKAALLLNLSSLVSATKMVTAFFRIKGHSVCSMLDTVPSPLTALNILLALNIIITVTVIHYTVLP